MLRTGPPCLFVGSSFILGSRVEALLGRQDRNGQQSGQDQYLPGLPLGNLQSLSQDLRILWVRLPECICSRGICAGPGLCKQSHPDTLMPPSLVSSLAMPVSACEVDLRFHQKTGLSHSRDSAGSHRTKGSPAPPQHFHTY